MSFHHHSPRFNNYSRNGGSSAFVFSSSPCREVIVPSPTHNNQLNRTFPGASLSLSSTPPSPSGPGFSQPISIPSRRMLFSQHNHSAGDEEFFDNGCQQHQQTPILSSSPLVIAPIATGVTSNPPTALPASLTKHYLSRQHSTDVIYEDDEATGNHHRYSSPMSESLPPGAGGFSFEFQLDEEIQERFHNHHSHSYHHESPIRHSNTSSSRSSGNRPLSAHFHLQQQQSPQQHYSYQQQQQQQSPHYSYQPQQKHRHVDAFLGVCSKSEPVASSRLSPRHHAVHYSTSPACTTSTNSSNGSLYHHSSMYSWERRTRSCSDPSAPPLYTLEDYAGYELTTAFKSVCMIPPSGYQGNEPPPPYDDEDYRRVNELNRGTISDEDAAEAFANFLADSCCYGTNIRKLKDRIKTKEIRPGNGHQYMLETFYEERTTIWHQEPCTKNQHIDAVQNGSPPSAWDIEVAEPTVFQPKEIHVEVPHTASIKDCPNCHGKGRRYCNHCHGNGNRKCSICDGLGILQNFSPDELTFEKSSSTSVASRSCPHCNSGRRECTYCHGKGRITCVTCQGEGALKISIRLAVKWKILKDHKVEEGSQIPDKYMEKVSGTLVFQEQNERVYPLIDFPENEMNGLSAKLINNHKEQLKHAQIKMQRHFVREVPVAKVKSEWEKKEFVYWVYGGENCVYCPENPAKCFSKCSLV